MSCIGDFLYFCMRCLALIPLPMRRASVCGFLHEANVAVVFSFSLLSLCDIVYWEKKYKCEQKTCSFIFYFKRGYCDTVCYCHLSWSSWRALGFLFSKISKCSSFFPLILTPGKLCLLFYTFLSFLWRLQKGMFMWHVQKLPYPQWCEEPCWGSPRGTVIHTTQEIPLDHSIIASHLHT